MKVGELVHIPPVRTVIRLADLGDSKLRRHIIETFILTNEVSFALTNILDKVASPEGRGFFVIGNYGSGKSHLLNVLSLTLSDPEARRSFIQTCREHRPAADKLPPLLKQASTLNPLVVEISLVEHSNREYLEEIVLKQIATRLQANAQSAERSEKSAEAPADLLELPRREAFAKLKQSLEYSGFGGLVLLIDELSEFLRSKENARAYNEDVRFLQYLGEFAEAIPAWIIATMQENIENTGSLSGELLHKIKDRYPVRFYLSGEHVKKIVSGRLVRKKEGADRALTQILGQLENAFDGLPFSREDFFELYPVHPSTVDLLDELRPLFSQHRGVIDFIHHRLAGDPARGIDPFLEQPATELLTPDYIFDHFRDRLRETVETSPYSEQVFHYYEREIKGIFSDQEDAAIALRLLKLLILGALARAPKNFTAGELARLLLHRYSGLESQINYDYIHEIMEKLHAHGAYISARETDSGDSSYSVDLKADVTVLMKKKLENINKSLHENDPATIEGLLPWLEEASLPLKMLQQEPFQDLEITWQNTGRSGKLIFNSPAAISKELRTELREELFNRETDFLFFIIPPFYAGQDYTFTSWQAVYEEFDAELRQCVGLWMPREITGGEEEQLRRAYAYRILQEEYSADNSPTGRQIKKQVDMVLAEEKGAVKEIFRKIYYQGRLRAGDHMPTPASFGYMTFKELVSQLGSEILKKRFPRHSEIMPASDHQTGSLMQRTLDILFSPQLEQEELERGTKMMLDTYLGPLGLAKKKGRYYQLEISPKTSPLVKEFMARIPEDGQISLQRLYWHLRKGPFGLNATCFQILGTAAILSGAVSAYQGGKKLAPSQVNYYRFWKIEALGPGTLIKPELQKVMEELPFLPAKLRSGPLTFSAQQQAWEEIIAFKVEWTHKTAEIKKRIEQLKKYPFFSTINWDHLVKTANRFNSFLDEIKTSYASREGLERFLAACQSSPLVGDDWHRLKALEQFFDADLPEIMRLGHYVKNDNLVLPEGKQYAQLRKRYRLVRELLEEETLLWEEKHRERLKREFKQFREEYINLYLSEHKQAVGLERMKPYRTILETEAYRLLDQLGKINAVVVEEDMVNINRRLSQALERECHRADEMILEEQPLCPCGFVLGEKIDLPDQADLENQILSGIRAYITILQKPEQKQKLLAHTEHLELVGRRREAEPLRDLLTINIGPEDKGGIKDSSLVKQLNKLLNQNTIIQINRALTGDAMIAERPVEKLQDMLSDRVFNKTQLEELFQKWLAGEDAKPPDYIRVTRREETALISRESGPDWPEQAGREARSLLEEKFPRLISLSASVPETEIIALAMLWGWLKYHGPSVSPEAPTYEPLEVFEQLLHGQPEPLKEGWQHYQQDLAAMGESLWSGPEDLSEDFLARAAEQGNEIVSADQLLESYYHFGGISSHQFETLLLLMTDEPFFPAVSENLAAKLAARITAEESAPQLNIMAGMLGEVLKRGPETLPGLSALHRNSKYKSLEALHTLAECNRILRETERAAQNPPGNDKGWERLYRMLAPLELSLWQLTKEPAKSLVPEITVKRWFRHYASLMEPLSEAFAEHYQKDAVTRRQTLAELFRRLPGWTAKESSGRGVYLAILDGARLDTWDALLEQGLGAGGHNFRVLREGLLWALRPTITEVQLQSLKEENLLGHILYLDDKMVEELVSDPNAFLEAVDNSRLCRSHGQSLKAIKYNFIDDKIHASRDNLPQLLDELLMHSRKKLVPLLRYLPEGSLLMIVSDHGFKTNFYRDHNNKEEPLYLHGGDTFFEVLTPWILLKKQ